MLPGSFLQPLGKGNIVSQELLQGKPDWDLVTSFAGMGEKDCDSTNGSAGLGDQRYEWGGAVETTGVTEVSSVGATGAMVGDLRMGAKEAAAFNEPRGSVYGTEQREIDSKSRRKRE